MQNLPDLAQAQALALAIVDTLPEPFLVLDDSLHLLAGSRCFYQVYGEDPQSAHGRSMFELSGGQWDIPGLRELLAAVVDERITIDGFEFEGEFPKLGKRTLHLNALPIRDDSGSGRMVLVAIKDITERRVAEQEKQHLLEHTEELLEQQRTLLREMRHRIANSLQIIASILLLKAGAVSSEETKNELRAAHQRVMSVAAVQSHLHASDGIEQIEIGPYLAKLSSGLASSMVDPRQHIDITVRRASDQPRGEHRTDRDRTNHQRRQICFSGQPLVRPHRRHVRNGQVGLEADRRGQRGRPAAQRSARRLDRAGLRSRRRAGEAVEGPGLGNLVEKGNGRRRHQGHLRRSTAPRRLARSSCAQPISLFALAPR